MSDLGIIADGAVLIDGETITEVGTTRRVENLSKARHARVIDATGKVVLPGLIDSHSRPFAEKTQGWSEFLGAEPRMASHRNPVQPKSTSARTLLAAARQWTHEMAACGTTTVEIRVEGAYDAARRELRAASALSNDPIEVTGVFSASHSNRSSDFRDLLSWAARNGLAYACELPCGRGGLRREEIKRLAREAQSSGLRVKLLTGKAAPRGMADLARQAQALSVDIAGSLDRENVALLGGSDTIITLLLGVSHEVGGLYPSGRRLIDQAGAVCLATAFGPERCPSLSLPMMMSLACREAGLTPEESISACTLNAAAAMGRQATIGSIEPEKQGDVAIFNVPDYRLIPYYFGFNLCAMTIRRGKIIYRGATAPRLPSIRRGST